MKLKKVLAAAIASVLTVSALAVSSSAAIYVPNAEVTDENGNVLGTLDAKKRQLLDGENVIGTLSDDNITVVDADGNVIGKCAEEQPAPGLTIDANWLIQLYNVGNQEEGKPPTDYGIDVTQIASFTTYMEVVRGADEDLAIDLDLYDPAIDGFGGSFIYSANGGTIGSQSDSPVYKEESQDEFGNKVPAVTMFAKYNWPSNEWWGLPEEGDTPEGFENGNTGTVDYTKKLQAEYIRKFGYSLTYDVANDTSAEDIVWPAGGECYQVGLQEWGNDFALNIKVRALACKDAEGNLIIAFDGLGNKVDETQLNAIIDDLSQPYVPSTPVEDTTEDTAAPETSAADNNADNNNDVTTSTEAAATTTEAAASNSSSTNVGLIIGIIAAVVVVIIVIVIIVLKKKK